MRSTATSIDPRTENIEGKAKASVSHSRSKNIDHNNPGKEISTIWFILETEHSNDLMECTEYHRETIRPRLYLTETAAKQALKNLVISKSPEHNGYILDQYGFDGVRSYYIFSAAIDKMSHRKEIKIGESTWGDK